MTSADDPLEFPPGEGVTLLEHSYTVEQVLELCELWLPLVTASPDFERERLAAKCPVPFELLSCEDPAWVCPPPGVRLRGGSHGR